MSVTIQYIERQDMTLVTKEVKARIWACHWAERPSKEKIREDMRVGEAVFYPFNESTGQYLTSTSSGRRFKR